MKTRSFVFRVVSIVGVLAMLSGCGTNSPMLPAATCAVCGVVTNDGVEATTGGVFVGGGHALADSATTGDGEWRDGVFMGGGH